MSRQNDGGTEYRGQTPIKAKIVEWLRENHPDEWVSVSGIQLQVCRGLVSDGLAEISGTYGRWKVRLTDAGRRA